MLLLILSTRGERFSVVVATCSVHSVYVNDAHDVYCSDAHHVYSNDTLGMYSNDRRGVLYAYSCCAYQYRRGCWRRYCSTGHCRHPCCCRFLHLPTSEAQASSQVWGLLGKSFSAQIQVGTMKLWNFLIFASFLLQFCFSRNEFIAGVQDVNFLLHKCLFVFLIGKPTLTIMPSKVEVFVGILQDVKLQKFCHILEHLRHLGLEENSFICDFCLN